MSEKKITNPTIKDAIDLALEVRWFDQKDGERTYARALRAAALLPGGLGHSGKLTPADLRAVAQELRDPAGPSLSASSVNRHLAALRGALRVAQAEGWFHEFYAVPVWTALREPPGRLDVPSMEQVKALLNALHGTTTLIVASILAETGCRLSEVLALEHKDLQDGKLLIRDSKSGHGRVVPFFPLTDDARKQQWGAACVAMLTGDRDLRPSARTVNEYFTAARVAAALPSFITPHSLRHFHATRLAEAGVPVPTIANILGHRSWKTTMRYVHSTPSALSDAVAAVAKKGN